MLQSRLRTDAFTARLVAVFTIAAAGCGSGDTVRAPGVFLDSINPAPIPDVAGPVVGQDVVAAPVDVSPPSTDAGVPPVKDVSSPPPDTQTVSSFRRDTTDEADGDGSGTNDDVGDPTGATCGFDQDCQACAFPTAPIAVDDCYCVLCATEIVATATCDVNAAAWEAVCNNGQWTERDACPTPRCIGAPAGACRDGQCMAACNLAICPEPGCAPEEQVQPWNSCCPRCSGLSSCQLRRDCEHCYYTRPVTAAEECYCPTCETDVLSAAECGANRASWEDYCRPWPLPGAACDDVLCLVDTTPITCDARGQCELDPDRCRTNVECTSCQFAAVPISPGDCACPECPVATSQTHCEAILEATAQLCVSFDYSSCPEVSCLTPGPICDNLSGRCSFNNPIER